MAGDSWYPKSSEYWFDAEEYDYPFRYGDMFNCPDNPACTTTRGRPWGAVLILTPSCELGAKATADTEVLVMRVNQINALGTNSRALVRVGFAEKQGKVVVAHANTFWLAPPPGADDEIDFYGDFRVAQRVPLRELIEGGRIGAMSHEARAYLIRREIYFKYRWLLDVDEVRQHEAWRIGHDPYVGPRPQWPLPERP